MIVNNLDVRWSFRRPPKANSELVIDANAPLTFSVPAQRFKPISRWYAHIIHTLCQIKLDQFAQSLPLDSGPPANVLQPEQFFRVGTPERFNHQSNDNVFRY